jgi:hypothetical protein
MTGFVKIFGEPGAQLQNMFEAVAVIPALLRPEVADSLCFVFARDLRGRIHVMIGTHKFAANLSMLDPICWARPFNCLVQVFYPGYSTAGRHYGLSPAGSGGGQRCILSYIANRPYVAYLDDDDWWQADHLRLLFTSTIYIVQKEIAIAGNDGLPAFDRSIPTLPGARVRRSRNEGRLC